VAAHTPQPQHEIPSRSSGPPGWQTAVMVLVAFIVGLLPYVVTQGKWATKDEVSQIRDRQNEGLLQVAANTQHMNAVDADVASLKQDIEILRQQINTLIGVYGPTLGSPGSSPDG